jgi:hypothetical protein
MGASTSTADGNFKTLMARERDSSARVVEAGNFNGTD